MNNFKIGDRVCMTEEGLSLCRKRVGEEKFYLSGEHKKVFLDILDANGFGVVVEYSYFRSYIIKLDNGNEHTIPEMFLTLHFNNNKCEYCDSITQNIINCQKSCGKTSRLCCDHKDKNICKSCELKASAKYKYTLYF